MKPWGHFNLPGGWSGSWDLNLPHPSVRWYWHDEGKGSLSFQFGDGLSDPNLSLDSPAWTPPAWVGRLLDRIA